MVQLMRKDYLQTFPALSVVRYSFILVCCEENENCKLLGLSYRIYKWLYISKLAGIYRTLNIYHGQMDGLLMLQQEAL